MAANINVKVNIGDQSGGPIIAARVKELREGKLRLNQKEFAQIVGVKQPIVSQWESAKYRPSPFALMKMGDLAQDDKLWWYEQAGPEHAKRLKEEKNGSSVIEMPSERQTTLDKNLLIFVVETVDKELRRRKLKLPSSKYAELVALFYELCQQTGRRDATIVSRLLMIA